VSMIEEIRLNAVSVARSTRPTVRRWGRSLWLTRLTLRRMLDRDEALLNLELHERQMWLHERQMALYKRSWTLHEKRLALHTRAWLVSLFCTMTLRQKITSYHTL
jgi:hypothetical protein